MTQSIQVLKNVHQGQIVWVVGKGPSLNNLTKEHFGEGPVIAINHAGIKIGFLELDNPCYIMQKDAGHGFDLKGLPLLVHEREASRDYREEYEPRYCWDNMRDFGLQWYDCSGMTSIRLAQLMGCMKIMFLCFDAATSEDERTFIPNEFGPKGGMVSFEGCFYIRQGEQMKKLLGDFPHEWVTVN